MVCKGSYNFVECMLYEVITGDIMIIIPGPNSQNIAKEVAKLTNSELARVEAKQFPDGETYVRIHSDVKGKDAVIIDTQNMQNDSVITSYSIHYTKLYEHCLRYAVFLSSMLFFTSSVLDTYVDNASSSANLVFSIISAVFKSESNLSVDCCSILEVIVLFETNPSITIGIMTLIV